MHLTLNVLLRACYGLIYVVLVCKLLIFAAFFPGLLLEKMFKFQ